MGFLKAVLRSKKAGAAIFGSIANLMVSFGLDPGIAEAITNLVMAFIASQGAVDLGLAIKGQKKE